MRPNHEGSEEQATCDSSECSTHAPLSWGMDGPAAAHGFKLLEWFDQPENFGNGDGWIDSSDFVYSRLQVWVDANQNGISEAPELKSLFEHGVVRLSTDAKYKRHRDEYGNHFAYRGTEIIVWQGKLESRPAWDVFFVVGQP